MKRCALNQLSAQKSFQMTSQENLECYGIKMSLRDLALSLLKTL